MFEECKATDFRPVYKLAAFLVLLTAYRFGLMATGVVELSGDEAHYWEWSRNLDWCYYSKPPGVALAIWIGTSIFGNTELGVRFIALIASLCASIFAYLLGKQAYGENVGFWAGILVQIIPIFSAFGLGLTPDSLLVLFWMAALYWFYRAWMRGKVFDWIMLTLSLGLGMLSKYAIIFFYIPAAMVLVLTPQGRSRLKTPWPYVALICSLAFFLPVIFWNNTHNWVMFRHDLGHTHAKDGMVFSLVDMVEFIGGQLGIVTPILAVAILYLLIKTRKENAFWFWMSAPILVGFFLKSMQGKIQPNWAMPAWIAGLFPLSQFMVYEYGKKTKRTKRLVSAGLILAAIVTLFLHVPFLALSIPWPKDINPLKKLVGWKQLGAEVTRLERLLPKPVFIFSDNYMTSSELAFYTDGRPRTYCINLGRRMNQYDLWDGFYDRVGENAVFVCKGKINPQLAQAFSKIEEHPIEIKDRYGRVVKKYNAYACYDFHGWKQKDTNSF